MTDAYVHVAVEPGETPRVGSAVREGDHVEAAHVVTGEWDLVVRLDVGGVTARTIDRLQEEIADEPRDGTLDDAIAAVESIEGVAETTTAVAFEP